MESVGEQPIHVFVSYAHADRRWLERLVVHLKPLRESSKIVAWDDTKIKSGSKWKTEIKNAVDRAHAAVLLISADFLASDFIRTDELPPLLLSAEEKGTPILPVIVSPCLFNRLQHLYQFQAINDPAVPLVDMSCGQQEAVFVKIANTIWDLAESKPAKSGPIGSSDTAPTTGEDFLHPQTWTRLLKIGDWILDEAAGRIIGSGQNAFLVSREEYGEKPFWIRSVLEFSNFSYPGSQPRQLGMNSGLVFGWKDEKQKARYYNLLLSGNDLLLERNGFAETDQRRSRHLTDAVPFAVQPGQPVSLDINVTEATIRVYSDGALCRRWRLHSADRWLGRSALFGWAEHVSATWLTAGHMAS
jgi:hypothetical protein